jgi:FkbM family methyltransferase
MSGTLRLIVRRAGERLIDALAPRVYRLPLLYALRKSLGVLDPLIAQLPSCAFERGRAIDIGANDGMFTIPLSQLFDKVEAFEPQQEYVDLIGPYAMRRGSNITLYQVGLADVSGSMLLRIPLVPRPNRNPYVSKGLATLRADDSERFEDAIRYEVSVKRLDDYGFESVNFIKIDVEGFEMEVLRGAVETLQRCKPSLLVEIEQRHLTGVTVLEVIQFVERLGYHGYYLIGDQKYDAAGFDVGTHQDRYLDDIMGAMRAGRYINNFLFRPL